MAETETKNVSASEDEILDQIFDKAGLPDEPSAFETKMNPEVKQMVLEEEPKEEPAGKKSETKKSSKKEEPASKKEDSRPQDTSPELKAAYKALRRDGVPYHLLDKMSSESPEELLEWAEKARKRQEDVDTKIGKKDGKSSKDNEVKDEGESKEEGVSEDSSEEDAEDTISKIKEQFGDEASEPLLKLNSQLQRQNENLQAQMQAMQEAQLNDALALSERVLSNLWPDLSTNRESIHQRMAQIGKEHPNEFSSVEQMKFAAAVDILGEPKNQEKETKQPNQSAAEPDPRDLGQPANQSGGSMPQAMMSSAEREDAALEVLLNGGTREEAKRAFSQS